VEERSDPKPGTRAFGQHPRFGRPAYQRPGRVTL
jgi:hypothetical protein